MDVKRNNTIDLLRFIISILIVPIHGDLFKDFSTPLFYCFTTGFARLGVPFFFITSGYFMKNKIENGKSIKNNVLRNLKLWLIFLALDFIITGWFYYPNFATIGEFLHKALFVGLSDAYWFFPVLIASQLLLLPVFKKNREYLTLFIGFFLYLFSMTHDSYSFLFGNSVIGRLSELHTKIFIFPQGGLVESIFFMSVGAVICLNREKICEWFSTKGKLLIITIVIFSILLVAEAGFTQSHGAYDGNCYLSLVFLPVLIFLWALVFDPVSSDTKKLGAASLYIYLIHPIAISVMRMTGVDTILRTFAATVISIVLAFLIVNVLDKRKADQLSHKGNRTRQ